MLNPANTGDIGVNPLLLENTVPVGANIILFENTTSVDEPTHIFAVFANPLNSSI